MGGAERSGTVLGLMGLAGNDSLVVDWVIPFTAGGFIYVGTGELRSPTAVRPVHVTVAILPALLENPSPAQSVRELLAMVCGIAVMMAIALAEH